MSRRAGFGSAPRGWSARRGVRCAGEARGHEFDGERAFTYLQQQVRFGPRIPDTPAHEQTGDWILTRLRERADTVIVQASRIGRAPAR